MRDLENRCDTLPRYLRHQVLVFVFFPPKELSLWLGKAAIEKILAELQGRIT